MSNSSTFRPWSMSAGPAQAEVLRLWSPSHCGDPRADCALRNLPTLATPVLAKVVASVGIMLFSGPPWCCASGLGRVRADLSERPGRLPWCSGRRTASVARHGGGGDRCALRAFGTPDSVSPRASAENEQFTTLLGFNADRRAGISWVLASVLAGAVGMLVRPITESQPLYGAPDSSARRCLLGRMSSFVVAAAPDSCSASSTKNFSDSLSSTGSSTSASARPPVPGNYHRHGRSG